MHCSDRAYFRHIYSLGVSIVCYRRCIHSTQIPTYPSLEFLKYAHLCYCYMPFFSPFMLDNLARSMESVGVERRYRDSRGVVGDRISRVGLGLLVLDTLSLEERRIGPAQYLFGVAGMPSLTIRSGSGQPGSKEPRMHGVVGMGRMDARHCHECSAIGLVQDGVFGTMTWFPESERTDGVTAP